MKELPEAFIINPNNRAEIAQAIKEALETPLEEQKRRNRIMQNRLRRYNVTRWADDFLNALVSARESHHRIEGGVAFAVGSRRHYPALPEQSPAGVDF